MGTKEKPNRVKILFYGQSITEQKWTEQVLADLRRRFPYADIDAQNKAIGGFVSQLLIRPAEHDVYPFYPDLVIFHVYGAHTDYEEIIKRIRTRTTAEVLMQRDHLGAGGIDPTANMQNRKDGFWDNFMNDEFLPTTAQKYGCGLADVRGEWVRYLADNNLKPKALLSDDIHLNEYGCYVMAKIVSQSLVYRPELPAPATATVKDVTAPRFTKNRCVVPFVGNRVELLPGAATDNLRVLIDGKPVSTHPDAMAFTRPAPNPWASPLALTMVQSTVPLVPEDWTLTVTKVVGDDPKTVKWEYTVRGSVTGEDGAGKSDAVFVSKSGRVKIEPESFYRGFSPPLPVGHTITWKSYLRGTDTVTSDKQSRVLLASGLSNGAHTLELVADGKTPPAIRAVRVYTPPVFP